MRLFDRFEDWNLCEELQSGLPELVDRFERISIPRDAHRSLAIIAIFNEQIPLIDLTEIKSSNNVLVN